MKCVKCDGVLARMTLDGVEVDECQKCHGIWFDFGELKEILEKEEARRLQAKLKAKPKGKADPALDAKKGPCPRCGGKGNLISVKDVDHGIHIDTCKICYGQWLDGGELEILREKGIFDTVAGFFRRVIG